MSNPKTIQPGLAIILPDGGAMGGVTVWAETVEAALRFPCVISRCQSTLDSSLTAITRARTQLEARGANRFVIAPQLSGIAYAAAVCEAQQHADVRLLGFMHSVLTYDALLLQRFHPALSVIGCVSRAAERCIRDRIPGCPPRVIPTAVDINGPVANGDWHTPLRLIYTGRLDAHQKRVLALPLILDELQQFGIRSTLTIVGSGSAEHRLREACDRDDRIQLLGTRTRSDMQQILADHDMLLLPSRSEGLGLSRLEAALAGCVPVVTPSGSAEGIDPGRSGLIVSVEELADDKAVARAFAEVIASGLQQDARAFRDNARSAAMRLSDPGRFSQEINSVIDEAAHAEQPVEGINALAADPTASALFTVPTDALERAQRKIAEISQSNNHARILIHGRGAHTEAINACLQHPAVCGIADDDPASWGTQSCGFSLIAPTNARAIGATDVIISSWLHQDAIWSRREIYESQGINVHRLYPAGV